MVYWTGLSYPLKDGDFLQKEWNTMKYIPKRAVSSTLTCYLLTLSPPFASSLEYRYHADLYDNYFHAHLYCERTGLPVLRNRTGNALGGMIE